MAAKPKPVDWALVETQYRTGIISLEAIAASQSISRGAIQKRAKAEGWTRDLSQRIDAARESKVAMRMVADKVANSATDKAIVDAVAESQSLVIAKHQVQIAKAGTVVAEMLGELGALNNTELQEALEIVLKNKAENLSEKQYLALQKAFDAALSLPGRSVAVKNLVGSMSMVIDKDRQAHAIDKNDAGKLSVPEWLDAA